MRYSVKRRCRIFLKGYAFFSFAKNIGENIGKNISKKLDGKYNQKILDQAKQSETDPFKTASKRAIKETAEATGGLISNKIADPVAKSYEGKITKVSKNTQQNNSDTVANENDK